MFGYHDSNRCAYDLWSPVTANSTNERADANQHGYGVWEDTPYHSAIENRAFSAYAYHSQEVEDTIEMIAGGATALELYDNFSDSDLEYIEQQLYERYGIHADLILSD